MYDSSLPPPPLIPPDVQKHSRIGIASFVVGILSVLIICVAILIAFGYGFTMAAQNPSFQVDQNSPAIMSLGLLILIGPVLSLVGVGLGIGALFQKNDKKIFAILGLALNLLVILAFCILIGIDVSRQAGNLGL